MTFPSIRLEGAILTADLLDAIAREDKHSQKPADFGLDPSTKVKDEIASTWASAKALWTGYQAKIAALHEGQTGVSETRNLFIIPLLALLGYQPEKTEAETINGKSYAISHRDISRDGFPLHIMGWHDSLEKKRDSGGPRVSAHALVQEYLNLTEHSYGIITNGRQLRLLRDSSRLIKLSFLEFDLNRIFEEDLYADFAILFRLLHATRMPANRANASGSVIEKYHQESVDSGSRIRDGLAAAVAFSMQTVANGLLAHPANASLVDQFKNEPARANELHQNLLRWVYRTLFVLVIEERVLHHAPGATLRQRQLYRDYYSLQRLRRLADRPQLADRRAHDLWRAMHQSLRLYEAGGKGLPLGIAPLGSFLFREEGLQHLFQYQLDNRSLLQALNRLSTFTHPDTNVRMRVNYGALDVEEFGSVYESLLELRPRIIPEGEKLTFSYAQLAGNERKTTGSYYTPDSLVQCLMDSALDPVVEERLKGKTGPAAEEALLSIKVCDPAVGSGHFLIGAAHRLAQRLADIRAGEEALSPDVQRHALRDVVSRCLYGVDINPLSVELCKVSLWMLAMEPGKSLGFLDHHIQCGNSLLGATPRVLADGLPDDAFKPLTGDDPDICKEAKKSNKSERQQLALFHGTETAPWQHLGNLPAAMLAVGTMSDDTAAALHRKEQRYAELIRSTGYLGSRFLADAWCAAFVWKKTRDLPYPITNDVLRKIERNPHDCAPWMREEIERLRDRYQFFHWHLAFPEVFPVPVNGERPANKDAGWNGGFDFVLGNPPWERLRMEEAQFFATSSAEISGANSSTRSRLIARLEIENPALAKKWKEYCRETEGVSALIRNSGEFPDTGRGKFNLAGLFVEKATSLIGTKGMVGILVPTAIATDEAGKLLFERLVNQCRIVSLYDFENAEHLFADVDSRYRFCLLSVAGTSQSSEGFDCCFGLTSPNDVSDASRHLIISGADIGAINPNSRTCPVVKDPRDFSVLRMCHKLHGVLVRENPPSNPWGATPTFMFQMSDTTGSFRELDQVRIRSGTAEGECTEDDGSSIALTRLYEAKLIHQFDHRYATFESQPKVERDAGNAKEMSPNEKGPDAVAVTRFWIRQSEFTKKIASRPIQGRWLLSYREITNATNARTMIACVIPFVAAGRKIPQLYLKTDAQTTACLLAALNSFALDFLVRCKLSGTSIGNFLLEQLPFPLPESFNVQFLGSTLKQWIVERVLELTYTAWDLEPFARDSGWFGPPFVWDEARRFQLRCELDAAFLHLYGLSRADAAYILDTFPIVRRKDEAAHGTYRTRDTILALYDQFAEASTSGKPFVSPLDPPPGDIRACHPPRS